MYVADCVCLYNKNNSCTVCHYEYSTLIAQWWIHPFEEINYLNSSAIEKKIRANSNEHEVAFITESSYLRYF